MACADSGSPPGFGWESTMNVGKMLFAQLMDFLPWTTFARYVARYGGDKGVRTLNCAEQFRVMAFSPLTYQESLRDIETCLSAQAAKLYHMGFRKPVRRSTLADANESRDWRIWADFAQRLIIQARSLYASEDLGLELTNTVYALDSTTIDLCLSLFPWAHFRSTKATVKMHTLLDLRGSIPSFIHVSDGKLHDVCVFRPIVTVDYAESVTGVSRQRDRDFALIVTGPGKKVWIGRLASPLCFEASEHAPGAAIHAQDPRRITLPPHHRREPRSDRRRAPAIQGRGRQVPQARQQRRPVLAPAR